MSTLKTIQFENKEQALKFTNEWGAWLQKLSHNEFCSYIRENKDSQYQCLVVPNHNDLVEIVEKSNENLQLFNDVVLEMFLLSNPK